MTGVGTAAHGPSGLARSMSTGPEKTRAGKWGSGPVYWTAIGLITVLVAVTGSVLAEPGWFATAELGPGGVTFLASLAFVVAGAGARSGIIGDWKRGVETAKWLLSGVVGGLSVVGVWRSASDGAGAAVVALAVITFALGIAVFLMGTVAGSTWRALRHGGAVRVQLGRSAEIDG